MQPHYVVATAVRLAECDASIATFAGKEKTRTYLEASENQKQYLCREQMLKIGD